MTEKPYMPGTSRHAVYLRPERQTGFRLSFTGTFIILLVGALSLGPLTCAAPPHADRMPAHVSGILRIITDVAIDLAAFNTLLIPSLQSLRGPAGRSFEICVYGHSRGRELFRYSGDESAPVENRGENMSMAVLIRIIESGRTTRVLFAEATGEEEGQLMENIAREVLALLNAEGFRPITDPNR